MLHDPNERRKQAVNLFKGGATQRDISRAFNVSQSTIHNWCKRAGLTTESIARRADKSTFPAEVDDSRYRVIHPTVREMFHTPAHELELL